MKNPLAIIREEKDLYVSELAILSDVSVMTVQRIERGNVNRISPKVLATVERLGYSKDQFLEEYQEWKTYRFEQLEKQLG